MPHAVGDKMGMIKIIACLGWDAKQHQMMYEICCMSCKREYRVRADQLSNYGEKGCPYCRKNITSPLRPKDDLTNSEVKGYIVEQLLPTRDKNRRRQWLCRCMLCGEKKVFNQYDIKHGRMKICECARRRAFLRGKKKVSRDMLDSL